MFLTLHESIFLPKHEFFTFVFEKMPLHTWPWTKVQVFPNYKTVIKCSACQEVWGGGDGAVTLLWSLLKYYCILNCICG